MGERASRMGLAYRMFPNSLPFLKTDHSKCTFYSDSDLMSSEGRLWTREDGVSVEGQYPPSVSQDREEELSEAGGEKSCSTV